MTDPTAPQGAPRYCRHCHLAVPSKARVCGHCGRDPDRERTFEPGTVPTIACGTVLGGCLLIVVLAALAFVAPVLGLGFLGAVLGGGSPSR